jgi:hypothetical protein
MPIPKLVDRLKFAVTVAGAGVFNAGAAPTGCRAIAKAVSDGDMTGSDQNVSLGIDDGAGNWEMSLFTVNTAGNPVTITRSQLIRSSAGSTAPTYTGSSITAYSDISAQTFARVAIDSDVPFSQAVPLTQVGTAWMPQYTVTGPLAFAPTAGAVRGAYATGGIIADGASAVTFPGFSQAGGSSDYVNQAGILNVLEFSYDGYNYWYAISQAVGATPIDTTAPTIASAAVANATPTILTLTASEALDPNNVPATSAFAATGHTVTGVAVAGTAVNLTVSPAFATGEAARTVSYTQPASAGLRDQSNNLMASFSGLAITNNVQPADTTPPTVSSAQVAAASPTVIQITMSETLAASTPPASAFAVSGGKTVSSVSISGAAVSLTCSAAYANGDTITVTYTQPSTNPRLQDPSGNVTASFGPVGVTNNVTAAAPAQYPRMASGSASGESGTGPYSYTATTGGYTGRLLTPAMAGDGYYIFRQEVFAPIWFGMHNAAQMSYSAPNTQNPGNAAYSISTGSGTWVPGQQVSPAGTLTAANSVPISNNGVKSLGDWVRWQRVGTTLTVDVSKDQGSTWKNVYTWTGVSGTLYPEIACNSTFTLMGGAGLA